MNFVQPIRDIEKIEEVKAFLANKNKRDELLFCFGIYTGLRISDILPVKKKDVYNKDVFYVTEIKTQRSRKKSRKYTNRKRVPIVTELKKLLHVYCQELKDDDYLFKSRQGRNQPITRVRAYDILREAAHACGLTEIGTHIKENVWLSCLSRRKRCCTIAGHIWAQRTVYYKKIYRC